MSDNLLRLYTQIQKPPTDRRQQNLSVDFERRSGVDRRLEQRQNLAPDLKKDIVKVKNNFDEIYSAFKGYDNLTNDNTDYYMSAIKMQKALKESKVEAKKKDLINFILSPLPMVRRVINVENNAENDYKGKAIGLAMIAATNVKEDLRDMLSIFGKVKSDAPKGYYSKYGFFVGTTIEEKLQKTPWGKSFLQLDKTMGETVFKNFIEKVLKVKMKKGKFNKEITHLNGNVEKVLRRYVSFEGGRIGKTIALALYRIPRLSLFAAALLEVPTILKAKKNDRLRQASNSALSIALGVGCGALLSAILAPISPALPVMGLGFGYYIGNKIAKGIGFKLNSN